MATGAPQKPPNRPNGPSGYGAGGRDVDVGLSAVAQMARDDTRWFVVGVVVLALVVMLALPITVLLVVDVLKMKADLRYEIHELKKLKKELHEKAAASKSADSDGL